MKNKFYTLALFLTLLSATAFSQENLSAEQQKMLDEAKLTKPSPEEEAQARKMLETLQKGRAYQDEQQKALKELDEE